MEEHHLLLKTEHQPEDISFPRTPKNNNYDNPEISSH